MADVIDLAARREENRLVWVCNCGCTSARHFADGAVECSSCETVAGQTTGEWRERLPPEPETPKPLDGDTFRVVQIGGATAWFTKYAKRAGEAIVLVFIDADGGASTWSREDFETPAQRAWMGRQLAAVRRQILPKRAR